MAGLIVSLIVNFWLGIGSIKYGDRPIIKPFPQDQCLSKNTTLLAFNSTITATFIPKNTGYLLF